MASELEQGRDYYIEHGRFVFTAEYHLRRGYCCGSGCRHCPYPPAEPAAPIDSTDDPPSRSEPPPQTR